MLECGSKVFCCFLDVRKAFDIVWVGELLFKLFSDLGIHGRLKDLSILILRHVFYFQVLFHENSIFPKSTGHWVYYLICLCIYRL